MWYADIYYDCGMLNLLCLWYADIYRVCGMLTSYCVCGVLTFVIVVVHYMWIFIVFVVG